MAGLPIWHFLNQKIPVDDNDSGSPQQSQTNGQSIGQSLIDFWNRAAAGFGTSNGNFSCLPPTESWLRERGQSLPIEPETKLLGIELDGPTHVLNLISDTP